MLTALASKSVNASTPEDVVSRVPLPVVWAIITWPPETSAASTGLGVGFVTGGGGSGGCVEEKSMIPWLAGVALMVVMVSGAGLF